MPSPALVIFDCDGVLVDSEPLANLSLSEGLLELGLETSLEDTRRRYQGLSWASVLSDLEARLGHPVPDDWSLRRKARDRELFATQLKPIPGVERVVERLRRAGVPYCVASSGSVDKMRFTLSLTNLLSLFQGVLFSSEMVERGKPHPDLFLHAAERMGVAPAGAVVIEDSVPGVIGAKAADMAVLAFVRDPMSDRDGLEAAGGHLFDNMNDLPRLLEIP